VVVAYELALIAHFFVNDRWVFEQHRSPGRHRPENQGRSRHGQWRRLLAFHTSALTAELVTLAVAFLLLSGLAATLPRASLAPFVATIAGTVAATAITFSASFYWI